MSIFSYRMRLFLVILGALFTFFVKSLWAAPIFVPLSATSRTIPLNMNANIFYLVINPTTKTESYVLKPIKATTPAKGASYCGAAFSLRNKNSCLLKLQVHGEMMPAKIVGGPTLCYKNNLQNCTQPTLANRLNLIRGPILTLHALTATKYTLTSTQKATISYLLTNYKKQKLGFTMPAIQGVTHNARITGGLPTCGPNFVLGFKQQCLLSLLVTGSKISNTLKGGPKVCIKNTKTCFQPNPSQQLNITKKIPPAPKFKVGANVTNLSGTLVLQNNGGDDLILTSDGTKYFSTAISKGSPYKVTVSANLCNKPAVSRSLIRATSVRRTWY